MMDFDEHLEMASDPDNIPGVYNYCDAWCERCLFTSRCLTFKTRIRFEEELEFEKREEENKEFWNQVNEAVEDVKDLLEENDEEESFSDIDFFKDLDDDVDDAMNEHESHRRKASEQPISRASNRYMEMAESYFKSKEGKLDRFYTEGVGEHRVVVEGIDDKLTLQRISISVQVAFYYHFQIWVKINRALTSSYDDFENDEENADIPKDSEGSAKVALLGIDQSIAAWTTLNKYLVADQKEIGEIITLLKQLRQATERVFPGARAFKRPGFDD